MEDLTPCLLRHIDHRSSIETASFASSGFAAEKLAGVNPSCKGWYATSDRFTLVPHSDKH
jgi:hypothetical protein